LVWLIHYWFLLEEGRISTSVPVAGISVSIVLHGLIRIAEGTGKLTSGSLLSLLIGVLV